jgi:AcrR family transcriptional regulator
VDDNLGRRERRKLEARRRLMDAARQLIAEQGDAELRIADLTSTADLGFGTFYNHFESKEAIYAALLDWVFEGFANAMEAVLGEVSDPAEIIAVSTRYTVMRALREPVWGQFLVREGFSARSMDQGLGRRLLRDIRKGIAARRLTVADPLLSFASVGGATLGTIALALQLGSPQGQQSATFKELGSNLEQLPERVAKASLQMLGLGSAEAEKIAYRPLPTAQLPQPGNESAAAQISAKIPSAESGATGTQRGSRRRARG